MVARASPALQAGTGHVHCERASPVRSFRMLLAIALGGAVGSACRYSLGTWIAPRPSSFPWATLFINVSGSLLLGFLVRFLAGRPHAPALAAGLTVGFCGGFTTFSTFSLETVLLLERGAWARALLYALASLGLCVGGAMAGMASARAVGPAPIADVTSHSQP